MSETTSYLYSDKGVLKPTQSGIDFLENAVTDPTGDVYAFTGEGVSAITAAAAMARLSRSPHDLRATVLKEFVGDPEADRDGKDEDLLRRVITMFGDDSVQQLVGNHFVFEGVSNLATKGIEWGRLAAYLEQSTRYIEYDTRDENGRYKYYTPESVEGEAKEEYESTMDNLFENYSEVVHVLQEHIKASSSTPESERDGAWKAAVRAQACDAARPMLPVATKSTVGVFADGQAIENMIVRMNASENEELRGLSHQLLAEMRKVIPAFLERADKPERGGATTAYLSNTSLAIKSLAKAHFDRDINTDQLSDVESIEQPAYLANVFPINEMDILADIVFDHTNLSLTETKSIIDGLSDSEKENLFDAYFGERLNRRHRPGRALENVSYQFELVCDYGCFRDLQRHRMVDDLRWQKLTTRLGYDVPQLVKDAGLEDTFIESFKLSEELNKQMLDQGLEEDSQYATLLGHKMRWHVRMNAREAFHLLELRTAPQGHPGYRKLCKEMYDEIAKVHPRIAGHMNFINRDEDPELTRLAAERATALKQSRLAEKSGLAGDIN